MKNNILEQCIRGLTALAVVGALCCFAQPAAADAPEPGRLSDPFSGEFDRPFVLSRTGNFGYWVRSIVRIGSTGDVGFSTYEDEPGNRLRPATAVDARFPQIQTWGPIRIGDRCLANQNGNGVVAECDSSRPQLFFLDAKENNDSYKIDYVIYSFTGEPMVMANISTSDPLYGVWTQRMKFAAPNRSGGVLEAGWVDTSRGVTITSSPADYAIGSPVTGVAEPTSTVSIYDEHQTFLHQVTAGPDGTWSFPYPFIRHTSNFTVREQMWLGITDQVTAPAR